jgi:DnaJ-class molecular chaperone
MQNYRELLGVGENATQDEITRSFYRNIKSLDDTNDPNFKEKFMSYHDAFNNLTNVSNNIKLQYPQSFHNDFNLDSFSNNLHSFNTFLNYDPFGSFKKSHDMANRLFNTFNEFLETNITTSYSKTFSGISYIDENGNRKYETKSRTDKVKNGKKTTTEVTKIQDGNKLTTIEKLADGTEKKTVNDVSNNMLKN